jgi:hypothetical protein
LRAGFAEVEISPPIGTKKIGWLQDITIATVRDPLFARVAVFESDRERAAFVQLDLLSIRWTQVNDIRRRVEAQFGFPGERILVCATHNHAGPAVAGVEPLPRDESYIESMVRKVVAAFGQALAGSVEAEIGFGHALEWELARNRRFIMRDGTVKTHVNADLPVLCREGPIDPEVAAVAVRSRAGDMLGCLASFTCHPTHEGGTTVASAGYPGALAKEMKSRGAPVTVYLNGASGNVHHQDPFLQPHDRSIDDFGRRLADDVSAAMKEITYRPAVRIGMARRTLELPYRQITEAEIKGKVFGAQRFRSDEVYEAGTPHLIEKMRREKTNKAEVQALFFDEYAFVGIPAEYFVEHGLRIKEECHPKRALIVGQANGMVGYVPTRQAFKRGGYETTFISSSRLAPEAGDMLADAAIELVKQGN